METLLYEKLPKTEYAQWLEFLSSQELTPSDDADFTVILADSDGIAAVGSRCGSILKYIAVSPAHRGENLTAKILTELRKNAFAAGISHLFLYTKPKNLTLFEPLNFYRVAQTDSVLLMENRRDGIASHLAGIPRYEGRNGAVVMNCNPFTLGHRYLIEEAAGRCDRLYVFVLSEDRSEFPFAHRLELVKRGTADLENVTVCTTGGYLVSSATFPDYFLRKRTDITALQCELDCRIFALHFARALNISLRFAGSEDGSPVTECYNRAMERYLPELGVEFVEIHRKLSKNGEAISAASVRGLLGKNRPDELKALVPDSTYDHLEAHHLI